MQAATSDLPEVATRSEVSRYLRVSVPTLARWAMEGKGPAFKKAGGRRVIYMRQSVLAWLEGLDEGGQAKEAS
ncbi:helix-turn-helix transcriptional regulator [Microbacterium plantarum]|uniref:Helix-turn-helix transcriptional regulator n=1 Tax=Microbacterium plantarum TaxID=1816425 RepID=A0ABV5EUD6_9MICO